MSRPKHTKRSRPRPLPARKHRATAARAAERQSRRELEQWRRSQSTG
jgi:ribosomal protein S10